MSDQPITGVPAASAAPVKVPGRGGIWLGIALIVIGIVGAAATILVQRASYSGTVENLVRALPGYRSELLFEKTGTFTFYYEYAGTFTTTLDGAPQTVTLDAPPTPPEIDARLFDQNGDEVRIRGGVDDVSYDVSGFKGVAISQVDIEREGPYTLEIVSDSDASFALAAGKGTVSKPSTVLPAVIAVLGLLLGLVTILVSSSRRARARREAAQLAAIPAPASAPGAFPSPGTVVSPTGGPPWTQGPAAATSPPPVWASAPQPDAPPPATAPPSTWAAPGTGGAPRPDAPTAPTPVTAPMPVQPPPATPAAPPAFAPPGATGPPPETPAAEEDDTAPTPSPWGAPSPPTP